MADVVEVRNIRQGVALPPASSSALPSPTRSSRAKLSAQLPRSQRCSSSKANYILADHHLSFGRGAIPAKRFSMSARLSLWLLPPAQPSGINLKLRRVLHRKVESIFPGEAVPRFEPHITLAVGISSSFYEPMRPQEWLESIDLDTIRAEDLYVIFTGVKTGTTFTKKCYLQVKKTSGLIALESLLQRRIFESSDKEAAKASEEWDPHLSLLYWGGNLDNELLVKIQVAVNEAGINLSKNHTAWSGGRIQLVDTSKPVDQWEVLAERLL